MNRESENMHTTDLFKWTGYDGVKFTRPEEELKEVFINQDKAMRYLHSQGFRVESFDPRSIDLVDGSKELIRFNKIHQMSERDNVDEIIREDILTDAFLQIGLYTHTLAHLSEGFLKEHYDEISQNLPSDVVPYYRGVVTRGAKVYLGDFLKEKSERDYNALKKELGEEVSADDMDKFDNVGEEVLTNKQINDMLYKELLEKKKIKRFSDFAFVHVLLLPTLMLAISIIICLIYFAFNIIG